MPELLNIIDVAMRSGIFRSFTRLLEGSSLEHELRLEGSYTLFAPADIAFAYLPSETINQLLEAQNQGMLVDVLGYHLVRERYSAAQLRGLTRLRTAYGEDLIISNIGDLRVAGARLLQTDIQARNGVIHVIDRLLLPIMSATPQRKELGLSISMP